MTHDSSQPSAALLAEISRDLQPVKPSPLPSRLALRVAPFALAASFGVLMLIGLRKDAAALGPFVTWGASLAQLGLAVTLIWIAARESTPARLLPKNVVCSALAGTCLILVAFALLMFAAATPRAALSNRALWHFGIFCGVAGTVAGTPLVILFAWLFRRSLAARPALAGALYGAAAGLSVNAGWRLACPLSTPSHALLAHGGAVVVTTLLGALAAHLIAKRVTIYAPRL